MLTTIALLVLVVLLLWAYSAYRHNYWASRGVVTGHDGLPFLGHLHKNFSKRFKVWDYINEVYRNNRDSNVVGFYEFLSPSLLITNPELAKIILIKEFDHFVDRRIMKLSDDSDDSIFNHFLTQASGSHWKGVRSVLSPTFSSGKMKRMFDLVQLKADDLVSYIHDHTKTDSSLELKKTFMNYTVEVIASCAFGMEAEAFTNENSPFVVNATELFKQRISSLAKMLVFMIAPKLFRALKLTFMTDAMLFFSQAVKENIKQRENGLNRGDFLDLMIEARQDQENLTSKIPKYPLTDNIVVANSVLFLLAGFDTTATTLSFLAFFLAKHPEIQQRLREELQNTANENGNLTYQGLMEAKFLDACLSESLRLCAPAHITERKCTKEYKVPGTDVVIPVNMIVSVPIYSFHHDELYFSEPEEFRPDRFMPENKDNIMSGTYLPFGTGPRNCIGMRFAQMETKLAIAKILLDFEIGCAPGHEKLEFSTLPGLMRPRDELKITFIPLSKN